MPRAADWRAPDPKNTLYMDLDSGRVVIELAPAFAPAHVANIRALAKNGYWNGMSINRSQDNFVVQWGDPAEEDKDRKPLGRGTKAKLPTEFARKSKAWPSIACPTSMAGRRRSASPTVSRPVAILGPTPPGWRTATAPSAPAAMSLPIPATAPSCMS